MICPRCHADSTFTMLDDQTIEIRCFIHGEFYFSVTRDIHGKLIIESPKAKMHRMKRVFICKVCGKTRQDYQTYKKEREVCDHCMQDEKRENNRVYVDQTKRRNNPNSPWRRHQHKVKADILPYREMR